MMITLDKQLYLICIKTKGTEPNYAVECCVQIFWTNISTLFCFSVNGGQVNRE